MGEASEAIVRRLARFSQRVAGEAYEGAVECFPAPFQGLRVERFLPRVSLRFTLGYDPAPLPGLTALSVTILGPGAADRSSAVTAPSRSRLKDSGRGLAQSTVLGLVAPQGRILSMRVCP